mgnify:CR=1 FL=1
MIKPGDLPASSWEEKYKTEHKLRQEAEGETTIVKGIGQNSPEMKAAKAEINTLKETLKSRDYTRQHDYQFLVDENRRLEEERNMLLLDNKRLAHQIDDQVNKLRKAGAL